MAQACHRFPTVPSSQATAVLKAWVRGDEGALRHEFEEGLRLCTLEKLDGLAEERVELLKTVLTRLNDYPSALCARPPDPMVRLCINLLMHVADLSQPSEFQST